MLESMGNLITGGELVSEVVKECKGITSFSLRKEFPELGKLPSLWTHSYFASTAGNSSQETIQKYIDAQKGLRSCIR